MPRALLIVNRLSREGEADLETGLDFLREQQFDLEEIYLEKGSDIADTIRRLGPRSDLVIVGGGDGSMNAAAAPLMEIGTPLGILPMGTANDLARTLGIPPDPAEACRVIAGGRTHCIDLGRVNGRYFFNVASLGLAVRVTRLLTPEVKRRWGILGYGRCLFQALRENRSFRAVIRCDGRELRHRSIQIAVGNGRHYGGGMTVAEEAQIDDGRLHLYSLEPQSFWKLLRLAPALKKGAIADREQVLLLSGERMEIVTRRPLRIDTDGELTTRTPALFEVVPAALPVYVPDTYLESHGYGKDRSNGCRARSG